MKPKQDIDLAGLSEIINDLDLDGRSKTSIRLNKLKAGIKHGGSAAFIEIFTNNIAMNLLIENLLTKEILKDDKLLDPEGNLKSAISKDLMKLRGDTLSYLKMLQTVQNKTGETSNNNPLADLLNAD